MKTILLTALAVGLAALLLGAQVGSAGQTDVPLKRVMGANNSFNDPEYGVSLTYPAGWELVRGWRWGKNNEQTTFGLRRTKPSVATASLYYQKFSSESPRPPEIKDWFRDAFQKKEASRQKEARSYRNVPDSLRFETTSNGLPMCSYLATFMAGSERRAEYYIRVAGRETYVMFITQGSVKEIDEISTEVYRMADTVRMP
jgi:hypothetical protein